MPVAGGDEQIRVGPHERHGHRHLRAVGQDEVGPGAELLDHAEDVVPAAGVQAGRVLAELVQDLVHLECGQHMLDQDSHPDRAAVDAELVLREVEGVVPEARFEAALELRQVEVRARSALEQLLRIVEEDEAEVEQARRHRLAVDEDVPFGQVPAARPRDEHGRLLVQAVRLLLGLELDRAADRIREVALPLDDIRPRR